MRMGMTLAARKLVERSAIVDGWGPVGSVSTRESAERIRLSANSDRAPSPSKLFTLGAPSQPAVKHVSNSQSKNLRISRSLDKKDSGFGAGIDELRFQLTLISLYPCNLITELCEGRKSHAAVNRGQDSRRWPTAIPYSFGRFSH
jgi:hypothetical protein